MTEPPDLVASLRQRNEELSALNEIAHILSRPLELQPALELVCAQISTITGMDTIGVYALDESGQYLTLRAQHGMTPGLLAVVQRLGLDDPVTFQVATAGEPLTINDIQADTSSSFAGAKAEGYHAGIGVPILRHGKPIGVLMIASRTKTQYDPADVDLMLNIGRQISVAMENAELYMQMQQRVFELDGLAKLSAACAASLDPKALAQTAIDWIRRLLLADFSVVRFLEDSRFRLIASHSIQSRAPMEYLPLDSPIIAHLQRHEPIVTDDTQTATMSDEILQSMRTTQLEALLAVPLFARDRMIGLIAVGYPQPHKWQTREIDLLQTIADQVASSIDNAHLFQSVVAEQRKVQAIFDSGLSGLYATDTAGRIVMFNRAAERITGWSFDEICGKKWEDVLRDPTAGTGEPLVYEALRRGKSAFVYEGRHIRTRDGRVIAAAKAVAPLFNETNQVIGAVGAFWDRSRELAAEQAREELLRTAAHQLRTPITSLLLALQVLKRRNISAERRAAMLALAQKEGERLKTLAAQLLDLETITERQAPLLLEPVPIVPVMRALIRLYRATNQRQHRFHIDVPKPEPMVYAHLDAVEQILRNLIDNAINYSPAASLITLELAPAPEDRVDIAVRDQGPGIPLDEQEKIFLPFYRTDHAEKYRTYGHGLGLTIAQRLAKQIQGEIRVVSEPGQGAVFHFTLRRCP